MSSSLLLSSGCSLVVVVGTRVRRFLLSSRPVCEEAFLEAETTWRRVLDG